MVNDSNEKLRMRPKFGGKTQEDHEEEAKKVNINRSHQKKLTDSTTAGLTGQRQSPLN